MGKYEIANARHGGAGRADLREMQGSDCSRRCQCGDGYCLLLWIFLTPFLAIGAAMLGAFVSTIAGRTEIQLRDREGIIFTGIGRLGRKRRFDLAEVGEVRVLDESWCDSDGDRRQRSSVVIETKSSKEIRFGSMLTEERKKFLAGALRKILGVL